MLHIFAIGGYIEGEADAVRFFVGMYFDLMDVSWDCLMCLGFAAPLSERGWGYVSKK